MLHAHGMEKLDRRKTQSGKNQDCHGGRPLRRLEQVQIKCRKLPDCGKAPKIIVPRFHLAVGEIKSAAYDHDDAGRNRKKLRQQPACSDGIGWNKDISREIHDQIKGVARPAGEQILHVESARQRAVEPVDQKRQAETQKHSRPMASGGQDQREQCKRRPGRGEDMNRESADALDFRHLVLPQSSLTISADRPARFQLRPKPRNRDFSARATMISEPIQYSLFRIVTFLPASLPRIGVMAPSTYFWMRTMRVSPCIS